jgi:hypothetical protein
LTSELCRQCLHQHSSTALMPLPVSVWSWVLKTKALSSISAFITWLCTSEAL